MSQHTTHHLPQFGVPDPILLSHSIEAVSVVAIPCVWPILQGLEPLHIVLWRKGAVFNSCCSDDADDVQKLVLAAYQGACVRQALIAADMRPATGSLGQAYM